jgi:hypothetical protein
MAPIASANAISCGKTAFCELWTLLFYSKKHGFPVRTRVGTVPISAKTDFEFPDLSPAFLNRVREDIVSVGRCVVCIDRR